MDKALFTLPNIKKAMGLLAGLAVLQAFFIISQAYFLAVSITGLWNGAGIQKQLPSMSLFVLFFLLRHLLHYFRDTYLDEYAASTSQKLREEMLAKVFHLGPVIVQKYGTGNMVTMTLEGIHQAENYIHLVLLKMMNMMVIPWIIVIYLFFLDIRSAVILLIVFPLIIIFMIILGYAAQSKADKQYSAFKRLSNHFIDSLRGIDTLKLFGLSQPYEKSIYRTSENFRKATMSTLKVAILSTFALDFFTTLSVAIVAVFLGFQLMNGHILLLPALTTLILAPEFFLPIRDFASDYHATLDGKNAFHAITEVRQTPEFAPAPALSMGNWQPDHTITLEKVAYQYEESEKPALDQIDFHWQGLGKIGIIGMSGSGKTTLIHLLSGFLAPSSGSVSLNKTQVPHLALAAWQKQLIYIPQNPYLFRGTLRENIAFYHPAASDERILQAAEVSGLTALVAELPDGLDTIVGEKGRTLSGGQAQRIALARAFLDEERAILLFDEPTAHLDIETEEELKAQMLPLMENRLVFFATHRLHWMKEMDYILVLKDGILIEQGTPQELAKTGTHYQDLVKQMRGETL